MKLGLWADFLWEVRTFFRSQDFLEVFTPIAVICPGTEPSIEPFKTELHIGRGRRELFLRTSPELKIKRLLSMENPRLFEMGSVFRNEESTPLHEPEFMMLEWYRENSELDAIKNDTENLIRSLSQKFSPSKNLNFEHKTIRELFRLYLGLELTPEWSRTDYQNAVVKAGLSENLSSENAQVAWSIDDYFFFLMQEVEKKMDSEKIYFVSEYPPFQAAYAQLLPNGWAGRFEVYWQGMELANAFFEVSDPAVQRERFLADITKKISEGKTEVPMDEEFLAYLDSRSKNGGRNSEANLQRDMVKKGKPLPYSGIALGLERLFMALTGTKDIREIKPFPYSDLL